MASGGNSPSSSGRRAGWFRPQFVFLFFCLGVTIALADSVAVTAFNRQQAEVLLLTFSDTDSPEIAALIEEARGQILEGRNMPVRFTAEYVDAFFGHADVTHIRNALSLLREKHQGQAFDLGITAGGQAVPIIEEFHTQLFPNAGLMFSTVDSDNARLLLKRMPGATGSSDWEKLEVKPARAEFHSSPWEPYRWKILTLLFVLIIETVLIVVLLRNRASRRRIEERLHRKEEELSEAQRVAQLGSWQWDLHTNAASWSDALYTLTGLNLSPTIQSFQQLSHFFTPGSWKQLTESMEELRRSGKACELELEGCRADGARIWVLVRAQAVCDAEGRITGLRGMIQDITERKRAEENRLKHTAIVKSSDDAIISQDLDGIIVSWNSGAQHIFGFSEAEAVGRPISIIVPPELLYEHRSLLQRVKAGKPVEHLETLRVSKDRTRIHVSIAMSPVRDSSDRIVGISKVIRDITQDKQAQQALIESERRFRLMVDSAPVLMWLSGPDKLYTDFSKEWLRFTGRSMEEELAVGWEQNVHPDDLQARLQTYDRAFAARESFEAEYRMRRHDGQYRWILDRGVPRFTEDGSFAGYIGYCIDLTDQKEAKASLGELNSRLIRAQEEERARIAGELHDDINQRLALLANGFQELEASQAAPRTFQWTKQVRDLKQLTIEIAADLQHLSHRLHPSKLYYLGLASAVRDLCKEFSKQHKIEVECTVRDLPRQLDENISLSLFRMAQESLHNAAKHSRARHIKVELAGGAEAVRLRVEDDGIGFDPEHVGDSGLGLFSMRERLRLAGGAFSISSRPLLGTQVEGTVPTTTRQAQIA